jgi:Flp pilus assembly protein TadB
MGKPASEQFTSIEQTQPKHRGSQFLILVSVLVIVGGLLLAVAVDLVFGLLVAVVGFAALIALTAWAIRNWDWER